MMLRSLLFILLSLSAFNLYAYPLVHLTGIRINPSANSTRVQFMLSEKTFGRVRALHHPERIMIDFTQTQKNFTIQNAKLMNANVQSFTAEVMPNNVVRFIFYVTTAVTWTTKFLPNEAGGIILELNMISKTAKVINSTSLLQHKLERDILLAIEDAKLTQKKSVQIAIPPRQVQTVKSIFTVTKPQIFTIVIDAGHGGKDSGARGKYGVLEKNIVLAIAKKFADKVNQHSTMHAILTRDGDYFLPLRERLRFARQHNADLFVAIHADAYFENASGASVYALSKHGATSEAARWLAQRENYSELDEIELDSLQDKSLMLRSVLIDLAQTATIKDSVRLGKNMLNALGDVTSLRYSHVEQAPFMVLKSPDIPSILVETGFITNPREAKQLADAGYQEKLAQALYQGVNQYIRKNNAK